MKKLYTGLVTAKPPREVPGESIKSIVQELSSGNPTIHVPQGDTILDERERALLLYDAALTPSDMPGAYGLESWALDTARIIRASQIAKDKLPTVTMADVPTECMKTIDAINQHYINKGKYTQSLAARMRMEALTGVKLVPEALREAIQDIDWRPWQSVIDYARTLQEMVEKSGENKGTSPPPKGNPGDGDGDDGNDRNDSQPSDEWLNYGEKDEDDDSPSKSVGIKSAEDKEREQLEKSVIPNPNTGSKPRLSRFNPDPWAKGIIPKPVGDRTRPGKLENEDKIDILPMENKRKKGVCRKRPELEGCNPVAHHRYLIDGKVFKGAKIRGGMKGRGTVLVDMSGSMSWTPEDLQELLSIMPECSVYGYSGYGGGIAGRLVLLADRGKAAKVEAVTEWLSGKGSNIIDDSCLRFLAKCPKPRIWISDGGVTGCRDKQTPHIAALCNAAIVAGNILRVRFAKDAVKALTGK